LHLQSCSRDFSCPVSSTSNPQKTINNIKSRNAERVLGLGDYSYGDTVKCWIDTLDDSGLDLSRVKQNVGNHETDKSGKLSAFVNEYKPYPPSATVQYYSFNYQREAGGPKIHVLVMATEQWSKRNSPSLTVHAGKIVSIKKGPTGDEGSADLSIQASASRRLLSFYYR
jgi:hypothetical protein